MISTQPACFFFSKVSDYILHNYDPAASVYSTIYTIRVVWTQCTMLLFRISNKFEKVYAYFANS